jgi:hypothetical protein
MTQETPQPSQSEQDKHTERRILNDAELLSTGAKVVDGVLDVTGLQREDAYDMHLTSEEEEKRQTEFGQELDSAMHTLDLWRNFKLNEHPQWEQNTELNPRYYDSEDGEGQKNVTAQIWLVGDEDEKGIGEYAKSHPDENLPSPVYRLDVTTGKEKVTVAFDENATVLYELDRHTATIPLPVDWDRTTVNVTRVLRADNPEDAPAFRKALRPLLPIAEQLGRYTPEQARNAA